MTKQETNRRQGTEMFMEKSPLQQHLTPVSPVRNNSRGTRASLDSVVAQSTFSNLFLFSVTWKKTRKAIELESEFCCQRLACVRGANQWVSIEFFF